MNCIANTHMHAVQIYYVNVGLEWVSVRLDLIKYFGMEFEYAEFPFHKIKLNLP